MIKFIIYNTTIIVKTSFCKLCSNSGQMKMFTLSGCTLRYTLIKIKITIKKLWAITTDTLINYIKSMMFTSIYQYGRVF